MKIGQVIHIWEWKNPINFGFKCQSHHDPVLQIVSLCFLPQVFTKTEEVITKLEQKNHIDFLCMISRSKVKVTELESLHQQLVLRQ
jgi:hypothetical protein